MENNQETISKTIKNITKGIGIAFLSTIILLLIFSSVLTYSNVSENTIPVVIMIITAISILLGSSIGNSKIKKNGILNGGVIGVIYILILYFTSSILNWKFALSIKSLIMIILCIIFGIIGGIIGVNRK